VVWFIIQFRMKQDEDIADALDAERFAVEEADRRAEVDA
jgi:hypothetical protein